MNFIMNLFAKKCKHENKKEVFRYYPDRYIKQKCLNCDEMLYESMDDD